MVFRGLIGKFLLTYSPEQCEIGQVSESRADNVFCLFYMFVGRVLLFLL